MYTIGVKRRFLPGYKRYEVTAHSWGDFRFILNLVDGSQLVVPGFSVPSVRVYPDFWVHMREIQAAEERQRQRQPVHYEDVVANETPYPTPPRPEAPAARRSAAPVETQAKYLAGHAPEIREHPETETEQRLPPAPGGVNPEVYARATERVRGILQGAGVEGPVGTRPLPQ